MTLPSKFGEFTWPSLHFIGRSVFYRPAFGAILQIVLGLFLTSIVTILQKILKLACLEVAFLKIGFFVILVCNLQSSYVKKISDFEPPNWVWRLVKFHGHTLNGFRDLRGDGPPRRLSSRQKEQMLLTVNGIWGWEHPSEISKTAKGMSMKFLPLVGAYI